MQNVDIFTLSRATRTMECNHVEFVSHPELWLREKDWAQPINDRDTYVRSSEPVYQVTTHEGERVYLAMEPKLFELMACVVSPELARRYKRLEEQKQFLASEKSRAWGLWQDREQEVIRVKADLFTFQKAGFLRRLKYLFTGSIE